MTSHGDVLQQPQPTSLESGLNVARLRQDFPILSERPYGKPLVFLDTAASAQKPRAVIDAVKHCYEREYANIHRGVYYLSQRATEAYEETRDKARAFINARESREIVFVRGATEGINLVAQSYGRKFLKRGDEIVLTELEHHSNIVPWQFLRDTLGVVLKIVPMDAHGAINLDVVAETIGPRTKLVAVAHISNALGTVTPVREIIRLAHEAGAAVLVDGCQSAPHFPVDVQELDCDFFVFSGHKLYGPSGIGVLYGRAELLDAMPPYQGGGEMISTVTFEKTSFNEIPFKFEAGTPNIAGTIGLGAAFDYLTAIGMDVIEAHERQVHHEIQEMLSGVAGLRLIGTAPGKAGILSFIMEGAHAHDVGTILDREGVAVRAGHHCAQPTMKHFGVASTVRASLGLYNSTEDGRALVAALEKVREFFG